MIIKFANITKRGKKTFMCILRHHHLRYFLAPQIEPDSDQECSYNSPFILNLI